MYDLYQGISKYMGKELDHKVKRIVLYNTRWGLGTGVEPKEYDSFVESKCDREHTLTKAKQLK